MTDLAKQKQREYMKKWREKNREHVAAYSKEYCEANREKRLENSRKWRKTHAAQIREYRRRYWEKKAQEDKQHE